MHLYFQTHPGLLFYIILLLIWSFVWKGMALWKAARRSEKAWFIIILIVNTAGILEIIYIFLIAKDEKPKIDPAP